MQQRRAVTHRGPVRVTEKIFSREPVGFLRIIHGFVHDVGAGKSVHRHNDYQKTKVDEVATLFNVDTIPDVHSYSGTTCTGNKKCRNRADDGRIAIEETASRRRPRCLYLVPMIHGFVVMAHEALHWNG